MCNDLELSATNSYVTFQEQMNTSEESAILHDIDMQTSESQAACLAAMTQDKAYLESYGGKRPNAAQLSYLQVQGLVFLTYFKADWLSWLWYVNELIYIFSYSCGC